MLALTLGLSLLAPPPTMTSGLQLAARLEAAACSVPTELLVRMWRGHRADRSGDIEILPNEPDFVGHGGLPHSGPWDYIAQVPLLLYGPGFIRPQGAVGRTVTLADIAPTQAKLVDFHFNAPDGAPLTEALEPAGDRSRPPRLLVVVVWDGAGRFVLEEWPHAWPNLRELIDRGTWYTRAEVGSSPPSTAQIHATIGTGAFSRTHGLVAHKMRIGERLTDPWDSGPRYLVASTFADLYDRAMGNRPKVGTVATVAIQLGMMGHGSMWGGGDRDLAVLREREGAATLGAEGVSWKLTSTVAPYYRIPGYANDLPPITSYFGRVDRTDGRLDGKWHGLPLDGASGEEAFKTPARIPFQTRLIEEVVRREGFGADAVPDLLFINYKLIDEIGHLRSMNSIEMRDAIKAQDADLPNLMGFLDQEVGKGEWVMILTADHGHTPHPGSSGAAVISPTAVADAIQAEFDTDGDDRRIVELTQPTQVFINRAEMQENGTKLEAISAILLEATKRDLEGAVYPVAAEVADEQAFIAAFPSALIDELPCLAGRLPDHGSRSVGA
jgi:hypothetical protein